MIFTNHKNPSDGSIGSLSFIAKWMVLVSLFILFVPVILVVGYFVALSTVALPFLAIPVLLACFLKDQVSLNTEIKEVGELLFISDFRPQTLDLNSFIKKNQYEDDIFLAG